MSRASRPEPGRSTPPHPHVFLARQLFPKAGEYDSRARFMSRLWGSGPIIELETRILPGEFGSGGGLGYTR